MMRSLWTSLSAAVTRHPGRVVVADVLFALASTLILLPPLLVWADDHRWLRGLALRGERAPRAEVPGPTPVGGS